MPSFGLCKGWRGHDYSTETRRAGGGKDRTLRDVAPYACLFSAVLTLQYVVTLITSRAIVDVCSRSCSFLCKSGHARDIHKNASILLDLCHIRLVDDWLISECRDVYLHD